MPCVYSRPVIVCNTRPFEAWGHRCRETTRTPRDDVSGSSAVDAAVQRAEGIIRGFQFVLEAHGCPGDLRESFRSQVYSYLNVLDENLFFARAKYICLSPMARYLRAEEPKRPDLAWHFQGRLWRWVKPRLVRNRRNTHLWYSWLQAKRAALPLSDGMVLATYRKHRDQMCKEDPLDDELHESLMDVLGPFIDHVRKAVFSSPLCPREDDCQAWGGGVSPSLEILGGPMGPDFSYIVGPDRVHCRESRHVASNKACLEATRSDGGQLGYLAKMSGCDSTFSLGDLYRVRWYPIAFTNHGVQVNCTVEDRRDFSREELWRDYLKFFSLQREQKRLVCKIQAVLEPLKVRVISKGPAGPYYLSKELQRVMHSSLRCLPCFRLIGRPFSPTDLIDLRERPFGDPQKGYHWFSVDYTAATDGLSARLSASILRGIIADLPEDHQRRLLSVLAPHRCEYPPVRVNGVIEEVPSVDQLNGQLMGSILSFPILCLANLGLCLLVLGSTRESAWDDSQGILINGDDALYLANPDYWVRHCELGKRVGLEMSPGKAYHDPSYANVNSTSVEYDVRISGSVPWQIDFLNTGLYFGQNKVLGKNGDGCSGDEVGFDRHCVVINKLLQGSLPGKQRWLLRRYHSLHRSDIRSECRWRNLYLPCSVGGLGQVPPAGWRFVVTRCQRRHAAALTERDPWVCVACEPYPHPPLLEVDGGFRAPWLFVDADRDLKRYRSTRHCLSIGSCKTGLARLHVRFG